MERTICRQLSLVELRGPVLANCEGNLILKFKNDKGCFDADELFLAHTRDLG